MSFSSSPSSSSSSSYSNPPCAACKFLRRKCLPDCIFAPYFPAEEPQQFANVHRIFGASNVGKTLSAIPPHQRQDAVNSLAYEAEARTKDPVYGCVAAISVLQRHVIRLQKELDDANADLMRYATAKPLPHHHQGYPGMEFVTMNQTAAYRDNNQQRASDNEFGMPPPAAGDRSPYYPEVVDADC
ncbi:LOB domain-containing protein 25-like [Ipomoea triloba]|uniref:LOB domain-containing protein 25-like n=1 Tax=Ipomoea triloba TaxID=35885 RepID=UPI00125D8543|nr:LOB domain-containing protein 25-like [Ipomoea triloba]XP_031115149.1 LOB domain-containing protein 25-like [Ipomoea triloba]XP_031115150.1 LOB domain-containing protein 25-like [Ipomoea triloba]XP_031115151.1 LOB domain-containing protein 25-like [Ipomoea triloba]